MRQHAKESGDASANQEPTGARLSRSRLVAVTASLFAGALPLLLASCDGYHYRIEITPKDGGFQRTFAVFHRGGAQPIEVDQEGKPKRGDREQAAAALPKKELARVAKLYELGEEDLDPRRNVFSKQFTGSTPDDVGGAGSLTLFPSALGTLSVYVERFRGNDDQYAVLTARQKAGDQFVDFMIGWLDAESGGDPELAELRAFLDGQFRRDVQNLILYIWQFDTTARLDESDSPLWQFLARSGQLLVERDYLEPAQIPEFVRALRPDDPQAPERLLRLARPIIAARAGFADDQELIERLRFLVDPESVRSSFDRYALGTEAYRKLFEQRNQQENRDEAEPLPAIAVLEDLLEATLPAIQLFNRDDRVEVKLAIANRPFLTNGKWDAETRHVLWDDRIERLSTVYHRWPVLHFAVWSEPDAAFQKARFGKVVLEGETLAQYCLWRNGLNEAEATEWDELIAELSPKTAAERLEGFRFSKERSQEGDKRPSLADAPRRLIRAGLKR